MQFMLKPLSFIVAFISLLMVSRVMGQTADTVRKEIPNDRRGRPDYMYKMAHQKAGQLGLYPLESGFDSLEVRIWLDYSLAVHRQLIVLTRKDGQWKGRFITMAIEWNKRGDSELVKHSSNVAVVPTMGWTAFRKELFALGITTLPNGPDGGEDGTSYDIEVANRNTYRFYSYWSPESTEDKDQGSKKMVSIIHLLERAFQFKRKQV
jgi:hypothetical protein